MRPMRPIILLLLTVVLLSGCSVFGESGVEIAPYKVLVKEDNYELRHYDRLVLATTAMDADNQRRNPFGKLFDYISGDNSQAQKIPMTAPVFMEQNEVSSENMSFVLPTNMSLQEAPLPTDPTVALEALDDYTVATITFSGRLKQENIQRHQALLETWIKSKAFTVIGPAKAAGYNPPFTIPSLRRNEILIPVEKPE